MRILLLLVILGLCDVSAAVAAPQQLVILFMNDPHAHYESYQIKGLDGLSGGFAKAQTVLLQQRLSAKREGAESLSLMAGDLLMGTPFSTYFKGELGSRLLNMMNFQAMVVGNHEFDYGFANLIKNVKGNLHMPLLSANITTSNGDHAFQRTAVFKLPGLESKIILIGLTTAETPIATLPSNVHGLDFQDPVAAAREVLKRANPEDLIIALSHLGVEEDKRLASACPLIDVIIGGHSHTALFQPVVENGVVICQAGAYAEYVGRLKISVDKGKVTQHQGELIRLTPDIPDDETILSIIRNHREKLGKCLQDVIGKTTVVLEGARWAVRSDIPTNLGQLIAYLMMKSTGSDAAIINGGAIRASIPKGEITREMVDTVLPFSNTVVRVNLSGEEVAAVILRSYNLEPNSGGKLQCYGIKVFNTSSGSIVSEIGTRAFDAQATYTVAISDFLAQGGDGYLILREKEKNALNSRLLINDLFTEFIQSHPLITHELLASILNSRNN